jgi:T5SS/PEP-CTERM-associated repeat protein
VSVEGASSQFNNTGSLGVGSSGTGTLNIASGRVSASSVFINGVV